jgi:uncharacterized protein GlcG (DUF336 family)
MCRRSKVGNHLCRIRVLRLSLTMEVARWPNRPPATPTRVPCPAGRHWRTAAARPPALPPHPPRPLRPRHRRRPRLCSTCRLAWRRPSAHHGPAERRARKVGVWMFIVVVDDCGVIKMSSRLDGNSQVSVILVPPKAVTANAFRTPPPRWPRGGRRSDPGRLDRRRRLSLLGGGVPLVVDGTVIGAVAACGGSPAQDAEVAQAGADALRWRVRSSWLTRSRARMAEPSGDAPRNRPNPQEASNDGTDPLRAARWRIRHRSGG